MGDGEAEDAAGAGQAAEADGGGLPVAAAGGEVPGEWPWVVSSSCTITKVLEEPQKPFTLFFMAGKATFP